MGLISTPPFRLLCLLLLLSLSGGCAPARSPVSHSLSHETAQASSPRPVSQPDPIYLAMPLPPEGSLLLPDGAPLPDGQFAARARAADYILLGEGHTSPCDHAVQARSIRQLAESGMRFVVGMEMFSTDMQPLLDRVNRGEVPLEDFEQAVDWKRAWGYDYALYRPVIEAIYAHRLPMVALNVPRALVRTVSREGLEALSPEERAQLPETIIPPVDAQRAALSEMVRAHSGMIRRAQNSTVESAPLSAMPASTPTNRSVPMPEPAASSISGDHKTSAQPASGTPSPAQPATVAKPTGMDSFFLVQSLWDTAMARESIRARQTSGLPVVALLGSGHVEFGWGIPHRIRALDPGSAILAITPWRGPSNPLRPIDPMEADLRFYCPATHQSRMGFTLTEKENGAYITAISPGSPADKAGFRAGDLLVSVNEKPVNSLWVLHTAAREAAVTNRPLVFIVLREGVQREIFLPTGAPPAAPDTSTPGNTVPTTPQN